MIQEHGFFHPTAGYWQTVGTPSEETLATFPEGTAEVPVKPGYGYEWDGSQWVEPSAPTPEELRAALPTLTARQVRLGLLSIDIPEASVEAALSEDPAGLIEWRYASSFERGHPLVASVAILFELPPEQVDSLWEWAALL